LRIPHAVSIFGKSIEKKNERQQPRREYPCQDLQNIDGTEKKPWRWLGGEKRHWEDTFMQGDTIAKSSGLRLAYAGRSKRCKQETT